MKSGFGLLVASWMVIGSAFATQSGPASPFSIWKTRSRSWGSGPITISKMQRDLSKIAVLDNGFYGYETQIGVSLPAGTQYHAGPVTPPDSKDRHGLVMAQILYGLTTDSGHVTAVRSRRVSSLQHVWILELQVGNSRRDQPQGRSRSLLASLGIRRKRRWTRLHRRSRVSGHESGSPLGQRLRRLWRHDI